MRQLPCLLAFILSLNGTASWAYDQTQTEEILLFGLPVIESSRFYGIIDERSRDADNEFGFSAGDEFYILYPSILCLGIEGAAESLARTRRSETFVDRLFGARQTEVGSYTTILSNTFSSEHFTLALHPDFDLSSFESEKIECENTDRDGSRLYAFRIRLFNGTNRFHDFDAHVMEVVFLNEESIDTGPYMLERSGEYGRQFLFDLIFDLLIPV